MGRNFLPIVHFEFTLEATNMGIFRGFVILSIFGFVFLPFVVTVSPVSYAQLGFALVGLDLLASALVGREGGG